MNDIYQTPESNLETQNENPFKPHGFWKFYFWFNVVMLCIIIIAIIGVMKLSDIHIFEGATLLDYIDIISSTITMIAIYGYAYSKPILFQKVWIASAVTYLSWCVFYVVIAPFIFGIEQYGEPATLDLTSLISAAFYIPTCIAIYLYAFKSGHIWNKPHNAPN
jgi:hypothetical protein